VNVGNAAPRAVSDQPVPSLASWMNGAAFASEAMARRAARGCWATVALVALAVGFWSFATSGRGWPGPPADPIDAAPAPVEPELDVPAWARSSDEPRHIAGQVLHAGRGAEATVHLRLDVPDPRVWAGRTVRTRPDGHFDLGVHPAGRYVIVALGPLGSDVVEVDTRHGDRLRVAVTVRACTRRSGRVVDDHSGRPLSGAAIVVVGVQVAVTDRTGRYAWCAPPALREQTAWAAGHLQDSWSLDADGDPSSWQEPGREVRLPSTPRPWRSRLVDEAGAPVAGVAVRPAVTAMLMASHSGTLWPPVQAVTDRDGWFELPTHGGTVCVVGGRATWKDRGFTRCEYGGDCALDPPLTPVRLRGRVRRGGRPAVDVAVAWRRTGMSPSRMACARISTGASISSASAAGRSRSSLATTSTWSTSNCSAVRRPSWRSSCAPVRSPCGSAERGTTS
jgi:hypothetical protein